MQTMYSNLYIICNLYKRHYQIMVSATKKHAIRPFTILGARQGATLSSHAFLELPRLPWPYVVMTCVDRVRPMVPVWFFEQVMMRENIFLLQGWVWLVSGMWFKFGLGGFYVDIYWFDGFDLLTDWLIASLAAKSPCWIEYLPIFPKNMTSTDMKHEKKSQDMSSNDTLW